MSAWARSGAGSCCARGKVGSGFEFDGGLIIEERTEIRGWFGANGDRSIKVRKTGLLFEKFGQSKRGSVRIWGRNERIDAVERVVDFAASLGQAENATKNLLNGSAGGNVGDGAEHVGEGAIPPFAEFLDRNNVPERIGS